MIKHIRQDVVNFALNELGTLESPKNSNIIKYNDWYYDPDTKKYLHTFYHKLKKDKRYHQLNNMYAWCGAFVAYILHFALNNHSKSIPKDFHFALNYIFFIEVFIDKILYINL